MLVDANILLYATDGSSRYHEPARQWLEGALNGSRRVGIPWRSLMAFLRIATNPRAQKRPLAPETAWTIIEAWLDAPATWVPGPGDGHREILGQLISEHMVTANLVPDAVLAAIGIEHGLTIVSADSDFARFTTVEWINPVSPV